MHHNCGERIVVAAAAAGGGYGGSNVETGTSSGGTRYRFGSIGKNDTT